MADKTLISWADRTHNEWLGCAKVSPACTGCYAQHLMETRMGRVVWGEPGKGEGTRALTAESNRLKPYAWNKKARDNPGATFVFCSSLSDWADNAVPIQWLADLLRKIWDTPNLTYLMLTKRIGIVMKRVAEALRLAGLPHWPSNAAIGITVVNQEEVDRDLPKLMATFHALNPPFIFISDEPSLGHVVLPPDFLALGQRAWAIWGGETDQGAHKARWADPAWAESMMAQCRAAGVPFHLKQMTRKAPTPAHLRVQERPEVVR